MELQSHQAFYFISLKHHSTGSQAIFAVLRSLVPKPALSKTYHVLQSPCHLALSTQLNSTLPGSWCIRSFRPDKVVKFPHKTPIPTLCGKVLPIAERESTEAGDVFRHHGPGLTEGHSSVTADVFDSGALHRGLRALGEKTAGIHVDSCYSHFCNHPPSQGPLPTPYRWSLSLSLHRFIFRPDRTSIRDLLDSPHDLLHLPSWTWLMGK